MKRRPAACFSQSSAMSLRGALLSAGLCGFVAGLRFNLHEAATQTAVQEEKTVEDILNSLLDVKEASFSFHEKQKEVYERKKQRCAKNLPALKAGLVEAEEKLGSVKSLIRDFRKQRKHWGKFLTKLNEKIQTQERRIKQQKRNNEAKLREVDVVESEQKTSMSELLRAQRVLRRGGMTSSTATGEASQILQRLRFEDTSPQKVGQYLAEAEANLDGTRARKKKMSEEAKGALAHATQVQENLLQEKDAAKSKSSSLKERMASARDDRRLVEKELKGLLKNLEGQEVLCGVVQYEWEQSLRAFGQEMKDFYFAEEMLGKDHEELKSFLEVQAEEARMNLMNQKVTSGSSKPKEQSSSSSAVEPYPLPPSDDSSTVSGSFVGDASWDLSDEDEDEDDADEVDEAKGVSKLSGGQSNSISTIGSSSAATQLTSQENAVQPAPTTSNHIAEQMKDSTSPRAGTASQSVLPWVQGNAPDSSTQEFFSTHAVMPWLLRGDVTPLPKTRAVSPVAGKDHKAALVDQEDLSHGQSSTSPSTRQSADSQATTMQDANSAGLLLTGNALMDRAFDIIDGVVNGPLDKPIFGSTAIPYTAVGNQQQHADADTRASQASTSVDRSNVNTASTTTVSFLQVGTAAVKVDNLGAKRQTRTSVRDLATAALGALSSWSASSASLLSIAEQERSVVDREVAALMADVPSPDQERDAMRKQIEAQEKTDASLLQLPSDGAEEATSHATLSGEFRAAVDVSTSTHINDVDEVKTLGTTTGSKDNKKTLTSVPASGLNEDDVTLLQLSRAADSLGLLQMALKAGPLDKVKRMISDMITRVQSDMAAAKGKREMCASEDGKNREQRQKLNHQLRSIDEQMALVDETLGTNAKEQEHNRERGLAADKAAQEATGERDVDKKLATELLQSGRKHLAKLDTLVADLRGIYERELDKVNLAKEVRDADDSLRENYIARERVADVGLLSSSGIVSSTSSTTSREDANVDNARLREEPVVLRSGQVSSAEPNAVVSNSNARSAFVEQVPVASSASTEKRAGPSPTESMEKASGASGRPGATKNEVAPVRPSTLASAVQQSEIEGIRPLSVPTIPHLSPLARSLPEPRLSTRDLSAFTDLDAQKLLDVSGKLLQFSSFLEVASGTSNSPKTAQAESLARTSQTSGPMLQATSVHSDTRIHPGTLVDARARELRQRVDTAVETEENELDNATSSLLHGSSSVSTAAEVQSALSSFVLTRRAGEPSVAPITLDSWRRALDLVQKVAENEMLKLFVVRGADVRDRSLHEKFLTEMQLLKADAEKSNAFLLQRMQKQKTLLGNLNTDRSEKLKELDYVEKYAQELASTCAGPTAEDARARRQKEVNGLKDALTILTGEEA